MINKIGDFVLVPVGKDNHEAVVEVVGIEYFNEFYLSAVVSLLKYQTEHKEEEITTEWIAVIRELFQVIVMQIREIKENKKQYGHPIFECGVQLVDMIYL